MKAIRTIRIYKILAGANINRDEAEQVIFGFAKKNALNTWTKPLPNGIAVAIMSQKPIKKQAIELARKLKEINKVGVILIYNNSAKLI